MSKAVRSDAQIIGKSSATVLKAWPEAASIIQEVTGDINEVTLVTPLESLLARFLPMLPNYSQAA
jgi:hypothetical protein